MSDKTQRILIDLDIFHIVIDTRLDKQKLDINQTNVEGLGNAKFEPMLWRSHTRHNTLPPLSKDFPVESFIKRIVSC